MCLILDANKYSTFLDPKNQDMEPVRDWLHRKNGKIVYAPTERLRQELDKHLQMKSKMREYRRSGRVKAISEEKVNKEANKLTGLASNDEHIIALAIVSKAKLLVSADKNLHTDFRNKTKGKVYQNKSHRHLLNKGTCP